MVTVRILIIGLLSVLGAVQPAPGAHQVLVEAESFTDHGGWKLDTQAIMTMGSPYLLAHGLGTPVEDATTTVEFPATGTYRVFVRTKDWVARWKAPGAPGRFQLKIDGQPLAATLGTESAVWFWQDGGTVEITSRRVRLTLHDLTGFEGRADAIFFTSDLDARPPDGSDVLPDWRKRLLGLPDQPIEHSGYDLVVIGGGYSGLGAAISGARQGLKVALIQNRPVLGGNGSSEIRVWAQGETRRGRYPHIGDIIEEISDHARLCPGPAGLYEDEKKDRVIRAEPNIDLFLNHHAYHVDMDGPRITGVHVFDTRTSEGKRFVGKLYVDCTGHGTLGALAGAGFDMTVPGHMGMTNLWRWQYIETAQPFPETPWALKLTEKDFPYPARPSVRGAEPDAGAGEWYWESGFGLDPIANQEYIRDWNFRAIYGAFNAMKNHGAFAQRDKSGKAHATAKLIWVAYVGGNRESRRLLGDVVLTQEDVVTKRAFPDGCVPSTWSIDLHYPKKQYAAKFPDNPFISIAKFDRRIDRAYGYPVPYRCFYSKNIENLFMAGRCASVTHEALGTVRVMKTCGMMGEVVGKAAAVCVNHDCTPREVFKSHWDDLDKLLRLRGLMRRDALDGDFYIRTTDLKNLAGRRKLGIDPKTLPGIVVDDALAEFTGGWSDKGELEGYVGFGYRYAQAASATARYQFTVPVAGRYEVRMSYGAHANRGTRVPVTVQHVGGETTVRVNQRDDPKLPGGFVALGVYEFRPDTQGVVVIGARDAGGTVHADAIQIIARD